MTTINIQDIPNVNVEDRSNINVGQTITGRISGNAYAYDKYYISLAENYLYTFTVEGLGYFDSEISLWDWDGNLVDYNDDYNGIDSQITYYSPDNIGGDYFIAVSEYWGGRGRYVLSTTGVNLESANSNDETEILTIFTSLEEGTKYEIENIRDFDGNLHAGAESSVKDDYKYQGEADLDGDGNKEDIFTNDASGRWASVGVDQVWDDYGAGGNTRVVGIYNDPLVLSGEVEAGGPHDSQTRFANDLLSDNLSLGVGGDFDSDGTQEVYWRTNDGSAYLRSLHHADGNIQYANYQSYAQMSDYLTSTGNSNLISTVVG